jgi:single-strand DNA-binding protein
MITVVGNLVDEPRMRTTESGIEVSSFRMGSTSRRFDREGEQWVDSGSLFLNVTCWRALGANVAASVGKGDPVIVRGRLFTRQYEKDGQLRSAYEVDAVTVGLDLSRGTSTFQRTARADVPATFTPTGPDGVPERPDDAEPPTGRPPDRSGDQDDEQSGDEPGEQSGNRPSRRRGRRPGATQDAVPDAYPVAVAS